MALDLADKPDGRTPVSGRFEWRAERGVQLVDRADLKTPHTKVRVSGRVEADDRADLALDADSVSLAAADDLLLRVRRALGNPEAVPTRFSGNGVFRGRWKGTLGAPVFEGRFAGHEVGYAGVVWGKADWAGSVDVTGVRSSSLFLSRGGATLSLDGLMQSGYYGGEDALDLRLRLQGWPAEDLVKAMSWDLDVTGPLTGMATVRGRRSRPEGQAEAVARGGRYYGVAFDEARLSTTWSGDVTRIRSGRAVLGGGAVEFRGTASDEGVYDGAAELRDVDVGALLPPGPEAARLGGRVSGQVTLQGTLDHPRLLARLSSARLFVGDEGLGALEASLIGRGDGAVTVDARCKSPRTDLALAGRVGAAPPYAGALRLVAKDTSLDPYLRALWPALPTALGMTASGEATLRGPLRSLRELEGEAALAALELSFPEYPVKNRDPVRVSLKDGTLRIDALALSGDGTDLDLGGTASLLPEGALGLLARGTADLRALTALTRRVRGAGSARLSVTVSGTREAPRAEGRLGFEGAGLRVRGFPHGLEDARGSIRFSEQALEIEGLKGTLAGGEVDLEGRATYAQGRLTSFDLRPVAREVALRYPEGLRTVLDADIRAFGDEDRQWVTGTVDVKQAVYRRRYDVASELLAARVATPEAAPSLAEGLRFDLRIKAPGSLRVDNNLANLQARADLTLQGTAQDPVLVGRAEVDRGRLYFQGQTYVVRRGVIDFTNPSKIDPLFDIEAETRIRSYRVNLKVGGTLARVTPTLTSDPPLSAVQILNLMAGADESVVTSLTEAQAGQAQLAATGAATLAAGRLSEQVGLERGVERVFGLNRFSIDPSIVRGGAGTTTSARLTVGKRLNPDLSVIYSQDLKGTEERIVSVEYILSDRLSLLLTREQPGGFGFDLRLRRTQR
jgi:translocation and assembly module TamB